MNNIAEVEVYNADGSLAQKEVQHNYVTAGTLKAIEIWARQLLMSFPDGYEYFANAVIDNTYIALTDNSDAIDTSEQQFEFTAIAFSRADNATGSDTRQGSLNEAESFRNNAQMKLVVDFPTDRGNGTFQSIHMASQYDLDFYDSHVPALSKSETRRNFSGAITGICTDSTYIYALEYQNKSEIHRINKSTYEYVDSISLSIDTSDNPQDICTDGTYFYISTGNGADYINKYTLSGASVSNFIASSITGITYISPYLYYSKNSALYRINTDFTNETFIASSVPGPYYCTDGVDIFTSGVIRRYNTSGVLQQVYGAPLLTANGLDYKDASTLYVGYYGIGEADISNAYNVTNRFRLDSPVTKNNTQTMKVTLTFNFS